jgi:hypothetical protein
MKVTQVHSLSVRLVASAVAIGVCAISTPWWGTPIVVAIAYLIFRMPTRTICALTFFAWLLAAAGRDVLNDFGPSRVFAKMLSMQSVGLTNDSIASRLCVYAFAGIVGFLLALFTGGALKSIFAMLPTKLRVQKTLR